MQKKLKKLEINCCGLFSSKNWLEMAEKDRKQRLSFRFVLARREIENSKKIVKKFQKFKNAIVASFQAIIRLYRPRNGKSKNYHSVSFQPVG